METMRRRIREYLSDGPKSLREISQEMRISEDDALDHLTHIDKARVGDTRLHLIPARCMTCGYVFAKRRRLSSPGRCPVCKGEHIEDPLYEISGPERS